MLKDLMSFPRVFRSIRSFMCSNLEEAERKLRIFP